MGSTKFLEVILGSATSKRLKNTALEVREKLTRGTQNLKVEIERKCTGILKVTRSVFFNLFEVAEHKMTSKKFAEPKLSSKNLCGTQITLKKVKNSS